MASRRLFVGNLHEDIQSAELETRFATFGKVGGVEVRKKNEAVFAFVDVEFVDEAGARRCVDVLNNTKWKGLVLKVQVAKENFIEKLKRELKAGDELRQDYRQQYKARYERPKKPDNFDFEIVSKSQSASRNKTPAKPEPKPRTVETERNKTSNREPEPKPETVKPERNMKSVREPEPEVRKSERNKKPTPEPELEPLKLTKKKKIVSLEPKVRISPNKHEIQSLDNKDEPQEQRTTLSKSVVVPKSSPKAKAKQQPSDDSGNDSDSASSSSESEPEHDGIPKFRGLGFYPGVLRPLSPKIVEEEETEAKVVPEKSVSAPEKPVPLPAKPAFGLKLNPRKKAQSDQLRLQACESRQRLQDTRSNVIRNALSKIDPEIQVPAPEHKVSKANTDFLFGAEEDYEDDTNLSLAIKPQYEGEAGQKMLQLKTTYGLDSRFQMDERFAEKRTSSNEAENQNSEKESQLDILGQILGPMDPTRVPKKPKLTAQAPTLQFVRYDPTLPAHKIYEKSKAEEPAPSQKVKKIKDMEKPSEAKIRIEEEKEKLKEPTAKTTFKVVPNLKSLFTAEPEKEQKFSFLKAFGGCGNTETDINEEASKPSTNGSATTSQLWNKKNPFKYDSSDDEGDQDGGDSKKSKKTKKPEFSPAPAPKNNFFKQDLFKKDELFFQNNDERLQSVFDQFLVSTEDLEEVTQKFNETGRSELKAIAKSKLRNSKRKNEKNIKIMKLVRKKKRREFLKKQKNFVAKRK